MPMSIQLTCKFYLFYGRKSFAGLAESEQQFKRARAISYKNSNRANKKIWEIIAAYQN